MYKILIGAVSISAGLLYYYLSQDTVIVSPITTLQKRQQILAILEELSFSLKQVYASIALYAVNLKQNSSEKLSSKYLSEVILSNYQLAKELRLAEEKTFDKFSINQEEFNQAINNEFQNDLEVTKLVQKLKKSLENAIQGFVIDEAIDIPYELTPFIVLKITKELFDVEMYLAFKKYEFKSSLGKNFNESDDEFDEALYEIENEKTQCKVNIFKKFEIFVNEADANRFLRTATRNYRMIDEKFKEKYSELEHNYNEKISEIFKKTISAEDFEKIKKKYYEYCY